MTDVSGWMDGWMDVVKLFFQIVTPSAIFSDSHETWHTCSTCKYAQNCGTDFQNFAFKIFVEFLKLFFLK